MRIQVAVFAVLALPIAACGSDKPAAKPTATATADRAADQKIANESGLKLADFPSGWKKVGEGGGEDTSCAPLVKAQKQTSAHNTADRFGQAGSQVQSTTYVFPDEQTAQQGYDQLASRGLRECLADTVKSALESEPNAKVGRLQTSSLKIEGPGDESVGTRLIAPISANGNQAEVDFDLALARTGRGVSIVLFVNALEPFDDELRGKLTTTTVKRLEQALNG
jgi:hypothetical protein